MKELFCLLIVSTLTNYLSAQNTGIGTTTPTEKLDVNGNLNVSGNIKINNTSGQNGQVLMTNGAGATTWANISEFKNFESINSVGTLNWFVPAGVTKILVEAWGGGGGGSVGGGGGGGGYIMTVFNVTPASPVTITVGGGGTGASTVGGSGTPGTTTTIVYGSIQVYAWGGGGGYFFEPGTGGGDGFSCCSPYIGYGGEGGYAATETFGQYNSSVYYSALQYGKGGNGALAPSTGGTGGFRSYNTATSSNFRLTTSTPGNVPGGGGGGGGNSSTFYGHNGARGMVIIRW